MSARRSIVFLLLVVLAAGALPGEPADQNLKTAKDLIKKQRYTEAIEALTGAIAADQGVSDHYRKRAEAYAGAGQPADAIKDLSKAIELEPLDRDLLSQRAKVYESQGMIKQAIADCSQALAIKRDFDILIQRSLLYGKAGQLDAAINDYSEVLKSQPFRADLYIGRGKLYRLTGQGQRAAEDFGRAIRLNPANGMQVSKALAETQPSKPVVVRPSLANIVPEAQPSARESKPASTGAKPGPVVAAAKPQAPEIVTQPERAVVVKGKKDKDKKSKSEEPQTAKAVVKPAPQEPSGLPQIRPEARVETIETTTVRTPRQPAVDPTPKPSEATPPQTTLANQQNNPQNQAINSTLQKGRSQLDAKQYAEAIISFTAVIESRPKQVDAYVRRCMAYYLSGDLKLAQADCDKAIEINPREADAHYYRGRILQSEKAYGPAIDEYTAAILLKPYFPDAFFFRAQADVAIDNLSAAIYNFSEAARQKQGFAEALQARADIKLQLGDKLGYERDLAALKGVKK